MLKDIALLQKRELESRFQETYVERKISIPWNLENDLITTEGDPDIYTTYPFDERFLDDVHPLDHTTGRTSQRLYDKVRDR